MQMYESLGSSGIRFGNGSNAMRIYEMEERSSVGFGNGNNMLVAYQMLDDTSADFGDGNNIFVAGSVFDSASVRFGDGNNLLFAMSVSGNVSITGGKGNNLFLIETLSSGTVSGGEGTTVSRFDEPGNATGQANAITAWNEAVSGLVAPGGGSLRFEDLHSTIYNWDAFSSIFSSAYWWNRG